MTFPATEDTQALKAKLRCEVVEGADGIEASRTAMEACLLRTEADIYFAPDWLLAWCSTWGRHGQLRILLAWDGPLLTGFLPFLVETLWVGPVPVRVARLAGLDPSHAVRAFPLPCSTNAVAVAALLDRLLSELADCHAISLSALSQDMEGLDLFHAAANRARWVTVTEDWARQYTLMRLPDRFETWLNSLSKSRRREYRRDLAALNGHGSPMIRQSTPQTAEEQLDAFVDLHTTQWRAVGKAGHFGDWPEALPFARTAMARLAPSNRAWIVEHWCGDRLLSAQYGFRQGARVYWWLIGRTLEPDLVRLGVGRVGLVERVRSLIAEGATEIEAGAGEYDYKLSYGGELVPMGRIVLATPRALWRVRLFVGYASLLDLLYYRLWFLKLAPRLRTVTGLRPRPLWRIWRRTRL